MLTLAASVYLYSLYIRITDVFVSRGLPSPSIVYAAPSSIREGMGISMPALIDKLKALDYHETEGFPVKQGYFSRGTADIALYTKKFEMPSYTIRPVQADVRFSGDKVSGISTPGGQDLGSVELGPEQLAVFFGDDFKLRTPVDLTSMPDALIDAVLVTEDVRFFEHGAIDINGVGRALVADVASLSIRQGGSTITQQLVKILFLSNERSFRRKIIEAIMAIMIFHKFSRAQILNAYLNDVYLGQDGHVSVIGMGAAASYYFSKPLERLSLAQCAMLAGMIASPNRYSPIYHHTDALERRNYVLSRLLQYKVISDDEYRAAITEPLSVQVSRVHVKVAPYFVDYIADQLTSSFSKQALTANGLRIFTTLDTDVQHMAEVAMANADAAPEGAMVVMQPQTGYVLALVGGRDYDKSQFDRAVMSKRQIGSCVKPFVYMAAFEDLAHKGFSQITMIDDAKLNVSTGASVWQPQNYDKRFRGRITVRYALQHSINIPAVKVAMDVGLKGLSVLLEQLGLDSDVPAFPSIALGSVSTSPIDLCRAYTIFSNNGYEPVVPVSITAITDLHSNTIYSAPLGFKPMASEQACYVVSNVLSGPETEGTGRGLRVFRIQGEYAGKTGTTNDFRDAWFAGYTPDVTAVDWFGYDNEARIGLPAAQIALPVIGRFLEMYTGMYGGSRFAVPPGIQFACVNRYTGVAGKGVTDCVQGAFIAGTQPRTGAVNSIIDWFRHLFSGH